MWLTGPDSSPSGKTMMTRQIMAITGMPVNSF